MSNWPHYWGLRSNAFWCDLLNSTIEQDLITLPKSQTALLVHGEQDRIIPVEDTYEIYAKARTLDLNFEIQIYPDMGHDFSQKLSELLLKIFDFTGGRQ